MEAFAPAVDLYFGRFDAHREDDMGNLGPGGSRLRMGHAPATHRSQPPLPGAHHFCLEGGYVLSALARSVAAHVKVLIGAD